MKKASIQRLATLLLSTGLLLLGNSCSESFINLTPITAASTASAYKSASDMILATNAAYGSLQAGGLFNIEYAFGDIASDVSQAPSSQCQGGFCDIDQFLVRPTGSAAAGVVNSRWNDGYQAIARCNILLGRIGAVDMDAALKTRLSSETKFIRALVYFTLVRTFGDIPIVTTEITSPSESYTFGREPVAKVYEQIVRDLTEAATGLPVRYTGADVGRATQGAAQALLGKVLLTQKNYAGAATALKAVIDANTYSLLPNYADVFRYNNGNNAEIVFSVQYVKGGIGEGSPFTNNFAPEFSVGAVVPVSPAGGNNIPTLDMIAAFEPGDLRRAVSVATSFTNTAGVVVQSAYTRKYLDPTLTAGFDASNDWPVLRYSDVLLMYAEALNETGNTTTALAFLNQVRKRAGLPDKTSLSQADFRLAVEQERFVELCFEGHRWWDLVRTGRAIPVMNAFFARNNIRNGATVVTVQEYQLLSPVPQGQIDVNPSLIKQNPGY